jgi:hypothetical protein
MTKRKPADQPRAFEEVKAANLADPFHAARIARFESGETFDDPNGATTIAGRARLAFTPIAKAAPIG